MIAAPNSLQRFYALCQGIRETRRSEVGFVGVDRPGGTSDAPSEDHEGRSAGSALGPVMLVEWPPWLRLYGRHRRQVVARNADVMAQDR